MGTPKPSSCSTLPASAPATAIAVAGGLVGKVMQLLGFGAKPDAHH